MLYHAKDEAFYLPHTVQRIHATYTWSENLYQYIIIIYGKENKMNKDAMAVWQFWKNHTFFC